MKKIKLFFVSMIVFCYGQFNGLSQTNTTLGTNAHPNNGGSQNTAIGNSSLNSNITGTNNTALGSQSLMNSTSGGYNIAVGRQSMLECISGEHNTALGFKSLSTNTTGNNNIAIGVRAMSGVGTNNNPPFSGYQQTGNDNIGLGFQSLNYLTTGSHNNSQGHRSLFNLDNGQYNIALGFRSADNLISGSNNVFIGSVLLDASSTNISNKIIIATGGNNGSYGAQRIYINDNGYMGLNIGNNVIPQNRLEIASGLVNTAGLRFRGINSSSATQTSNGKVLSVNANGDVILVPDQVGTGGGVGNTITAGNNISVNLTGTNYTISSDYENIYTHDGTLTADRTMDMADYNLHFNTSNSPSNGKIYIGDAPDYPTATGEYKLYVEGGILTEKVKVALRSTANWADYIFADDYQLKPLKEVEEFIKANNHLPGIESAQELVEKGLDLGEMQAKQMGKIEELTLYIIEQDKKLELQSKDIEELKALVKVLMEKK